jgi:hypothetical protein
MFPSGRRDQFADIGGLIVFVHGKALAELTTAESLAIEIENAVRHQPNAELPDLANRRRTCGCHDGSCERTEMRVFKAVPRQAIPHPGQRILAALFACSSPKGLIQNVSVFHRTGHRDHQVV